MPIQPLLVWYLLSELTPWSAIPSPLTQFHRNPTCLLFLAHLFAEPLFGEDFTALVQLFYPSVGILESGFHSDCWLSLPKPVHERDFLCLLQKYSLHVNAITTLSHRSHGNSSWHWWWMMATSHYSLRLYLWTGLRDFFCLKVKGSLKLVHARHDWWIQWSKLWRSPANTEL